MAVQMATTARVIILDNQVRVSAQIHSQRRIDVVGLIVFKKNGDKERGVQVFSHSRIRVRTAWRLEHIKQMLNRLLIDTNPMGYGTTRMPHAYHLDL